jgi:predicted phage terminase large subunit-like protein
MPQYRPAAVHRYMASKLEAVERGEIERLMLFLPPRTGKTELLIRFVAWCLGRHPDWPLLYTSYGADLAWDKSAEARNVVRSEEYEQTFGRLSTLDVPVVMDAQSHSVQRWRIAGHRGGLQAQGVGGPLTGKGGKVILVDDPVKNRQEADSATFRRRTWEWYTSTLRTRLEPSGRMILCMTRWHEDDLAGRLLRLAAEDPKADQWQVVSLPAIAKDSSGCGPQNDSAVVDPLGRQPGEALDPERYPVAALEQIKASIGSRDWVALYDQEPRPDEGNVFKRGWFRYVEKLPVCQYTTVAWDTAFEEQEQSDYSAAVLVGQAENGAFYVRPLIHERLAFPELTRAGIEQVRRWPAAEHIVEGKASGKSLRQQLRASGIPLIEVPTLGDKVARANSITRFFEAGMVFFVLGPGVDALETELLAFPNGAHDDQVDALVYGLIRASTRAGKKAAARSYSWASG